MSRTFSRSEYERSLAAWSEGEFSDEWRELRHTMALNGAIFPPAGSRWDSWDDDPPSQRAIIVRALRDTPELLRRCATGCPSWSVLVVRLMRAVTAWREEVAEREADFEREKRADREVSRTAMSHIADVMATIADSGRPIR